jgi:hypothetical protein
LCPWLSIVTPHAHLPGGLEGEKGKSDAIY